MNLSKNLLNIFSLKVFCIVLVLFLGFTKANAQCTATLPWTEGFESINANNQLPGCWSATSLGFSDLTYKTAPSQTYENRVPHTGNSFATFNYNAANDFFYTPGFVLAEGTTYQFSFWYITDGSGGSADNGEYNAYIYYGTDQTPATMTNSIGSIINFNNSTYAQYVVTFTPAISNTYYIGINAQNLNGNTVYGWSFDDVALSAISSATCSGTPVAGTVSPTNATVFAACATPTQTLTLSGYTAAAGITYQWQQATDGVNYSLISGATTPIYTGTFTASVTYANCVVTCTNSGISTISDTVTINNSPAAYIAVTTALPYSQGFESTWVDKCATDDVPDKYWVNTPTTGDASWRRDDDGASASWDNTGNGAYAPAGSDVNGASSAHSARFHAQAASQGATGALDVYLDLSAVGAKQIAYDYIYQGSANNGSSANLTVLLSTNGAAGPFNQIDYVDVNIFTFDWINRTVIDTTTSATCVLRFLATSDFGSNDIGLDNIAVNVLTPCSGAPAAATVTPASSSVTPCSPIQTLSLSGYASVSGLTYQWQRSTNGTNYTPIPGATGTTYTDVFSAATTYVNCVATCTASGLSTTSATATVTSTPQAYFSITAATPYTQDFENTWLSKCAVDDIPDMYWNNTPPTGDNSWRREDDGSSANWDDPNDGTSTLAGSNANGGSSLHSARYDVLDTYPGSTGALDLYLDLSATGTKQISYDVVNPSNQGDYLTVLISTTGPLGTFTELDSVATVTNWTTRTFTTTVTNATCILRFLGNSQGGFKNMGIDNVSVGLLTACSGAPAVAAVTPASVSLSSCSPSQLFTLPATYGYITGLTYQWQQSTDGTNYTQVPGATTASYTGTFTAPTTYVNCIITCTASATATTSSTAVVNYTQQGAYANLPYTQNFDNTWTDLCGTDNDAPDSYWINSSPAPIDGSQSTYLGWRRSDYNTWGSSGLYSPVAFSGAYSARFHTAGEFGANGSLDLRLNCSSGGTEEATFFYINTAGSDNMTVYLSTDGGVTFTSIGSYTDASAWTQENLTFASNSPQTILRFTGISVQGSNGGSDIGLDDLNVVILATCSGTPTPGTVIATTTQACATTSVTLGLLGGTQATSLTYQWQASVNGTTFTPISGATAATYTFSGQTTATWYNCVVTCTGNSATSNAQLIQEASLPNAVATVSLPAPNCVGDDLVLSAATATGNMYQWQLNGANISGATNSVYNSLDTAGQYQYTVVVTNGTCIATSSPVSVVIHPRPVIAITATSPVNFCAGDSTILTVYTDTAGGQVGFTTDTYQWQFNGSNTPTTIHQNASGLYVSDTATAAGIYTIIATNTNNCVTKIADTVTVYPLPATTVSTNGPLAFCQGDSVLLSASATNANSCQWLLNGNIISGATSTQYDASQQGIYTAALNTIHNCRDTSAADTVIVHPLPTPGITATGGQLGTTIYTSYQWYFNSQPIPGATAQYYTATTNGIYYIVVSDSNGCSGQSATDTVANLAVSNINAGDLFDVNAYPNPANDIVTVRVHGLTGNNRKVSLTDVTGRAISKMNMTTDSVDINMSDLAAGIYLVRYEDNTHTRVIKVNKQ